MNVLFFSTLFYENMLISMNVMFQLLPALRFLRTIVNEDSASPRKFLEAAINTGDSTLFYTGNYIVM